MKYLPLTKYYKTILTYDNNGNMILWFKPEKNFIKSYTSISR